MIFTTLYSAIATEARSAQWMTFIIIIIYFIYILFLQVLVAPGRLRVGSEASEDVERGTGRGNEIEDLRPLQAGAPYFWVNVLAIASMFWPTIIYRQESWRPFVFLWNTLRHFESNRYIVYFTFSVNSGQAQVVVVVTIIYRQKTWRWFMVANWLAFNSIVIPFSQLPVMCRAPVREWWTLPAAQSLTPGPRWRGFQRWFGDFLFFIWFGSHECKGGS